MPVCVSACLCARHASTFTFRGGSSGTRGERRQVKNYSCYLSIQRKRKVTSSEWFVVVDKPVAWSSTAVWTSMGSYFNGLRHTKYKKLFMHMHQRMYVSVIISLSTIAHDTYPLITAGGELALAICSATLDPPATDGSHSTNV